MVENIFVIDKIEEAEDNKGKRYIKITDKAGTTHNIKEGRNNLLTNKEHLLAEGIAIKPTYGEFVNPEGKKFPFIRDFEVVKDIFVRQAAEKAQGQVKEERTDSIESQVAFKGMVELLVAGIITKDDMAGKATIGWAMGRLNPAVEIISIIEKTKTTEEQPNPEEGEPEPEIKTAGDLFKWIMSKDKNIKAPRTWLNIEYKVDPKAVLTTEKIAELYNAIKEKMNW